jgi:CRISPR-associated protein Csd2
MSSLQNKIDFAVVLSVKNANPNGDPLNGNRPRADYNGYGEISDVCLKRKIRDRLQDAGLEIFVQSDDRKKDDATSLRDRADKALGKKFGSTETTGLACAKWVDVRAFSNCSHCRRQRRESRRTAMKKVIRESRFRSAARSRCSRPSVSNQWK